MATSSWTEETDEKINYTKLCRLLYDGGTLAVKTVFDAIVPPTSLTTTLAKHQPTLLKLKKPRGRVLSQDQWDLLYPPSGAGPKSEDFDITLLFVQLRNICGLTPPATGWDALPPTTDTSLEANLARIKYYRNKVIAHSSKAEVDHPDFETYWNNISGALVALGLKQGDIDKLKNTPLGEKDYNQLVKEWYLSDQEIKSQLQGLKSDTSQIITGIDYLKDRFETANCHINRLAHRDFDPFIERLCQKYHPKTREWLMNDVKSRVRQDYGHARIEVIQAGPGMGKSVVAAKLCQEYKNQGILGGCHFFKHDNSLHNNPRLMLQSVARQLYDLYPEYCNMLNRNLSKNLGKDMSELNCEELFTLLFEEPCSKLKPDGYFVIIIDALDECCNSLKRELFITLHQISTLHAPWLRFILTTRPPPSISSLQNLGAHIYIDPVGRNNTVDIQIYIADMLQEIKHAAVNYNDNQISQLVEITEGIFLVAYFIVDLLRNSNNPISEVVKKFPKGITSVYEDYFTRLQKELTPQMHSKEGFYDMLEAVVAAKYPIEKTMFYSILGLKDEPRGPTRRERKEAINHLHQLFPVENDHVSAFHKTVIDWLTTEDHDFSVKRDGHGVLADKCYNIIKAVTQKQIAETNPDDSPSLTDCDTYALKYGTVYFTESKRFSKEKKSEMETDPNVLCLQAFIAAQEYHAIEQTVGARYNDEVEQHLSNNVKVIYKSLRSLFYIQTKMPSQTECHEHPTFEQMVELAYQAAYLLQTGDTEKTLEYLKANDIPYIEKDTPLEINEAEGQVQQVIRFNSGFVVVQHVRDATLLRNYQLDGELVKKVLLDGHKTIFKSPDDKFIFAYFGGAYIERIDVVSLEVTSGYQCPNKVISCHVFGNQPWFILVRCYNNKLYIMDGDTGTVVGDPISVQQNEKVLSVNNQGCILLVRTSQSFSLPNIADQTRFGHPYTDDDGYVCELMLWESLCEVKMKGGGMRSQFRLERSTDMTIFVLRELFLLDYKNSVGKMLLNARRPNWCHCERYHPSLRGAKSETVYCFSQDGDLLAFHHNQCVTVVSTSDGSLYKSVCFVFNKVFIRKVLHLSKETMIVHGITGYLFGGAIDIIIDITFGDKVYDFQVERMIFLPRDVVVLSTVTSDDALVYLIVRQSKVIHKLDFHF